MVSPKILLTLALVATLHTSYGQTLSESDEKELIELKEKLALSNEQFVRFKALQEERMALRRDLGDKRSALADKREELQKSNADGKQAKEEMNKEMRSFRELLKEHRKWYHEQIRELFDETQMRKYKQLKLEKRQEAAIADQEERLKALKENAKLEEDQVDKIRQIYARYHTSLENLPEDSRKKAEKLRSLRKELDKEMRAVLTQKQYNKWKSTHGRQPRPRVSQRHKRDN